MVTKKIDELLMKINRIKLYKLLILISGFSLSVALTGYLSHTFSWFIFNRMTKSNAPKVQVQASLQVDYDIYVDESETPLAEDEIVFSSLIPGQTPRTVTVVATNTGQNDAALTLSFLAPLAAEEVPFVDTLGTYGPLGYYYYFGSQIELHAIETKINSVSVVTTNNVGAFLVPTTNVGVAKGQVTGVEDEITTFSPLDFVEDVVIAVGEEITIKTTFLFVDNGTDQNVYMEAWPANGVSSRTLHISLGEVFP